MGICLKFSENYRKLERGNRVILTNRDSGEWIKISKECISIIERGIYNKLNSEELLKCIEDREDRVYIDNLIRILYKMKLLDNNLNIDEKVDTIYINLTNQCNLKCKHCCVDADFISEYKRILSFEELKKVKDKIEVYGIPKLVFSGGEPMVRSDFWEILDYTRKNYKGKIDIATNATLINEANVDRLIANVNRLDISIDGIDEDSCSEIRGKGVFNKVIRSINLLKERGFDEIYLSMVISDYNKELKKGFLELNKELGTQAVIRIFAPVGRGLKNSDKFIKINKEIDNNIEIDDLSDARMNLRSIRCGAGVSDLAINYDGWVYPCGNLISEKFKLFNILEITTLEDAMKRTRDEYLIGNSLRSIQPDHYEKCKECDVNLFCWSCVEEIARLQNNEREFKERCINHKKVLEKILWDE